MSRNVVRSISRPRKTAKWLLPSPQHSIRRWYTEIEELDEGEETAAEKPILYDKEQSILLLRKLDQQHISQARKNTEDVVKIVRKAQESVAALPTTVQLLPETIPPYTLGYPRHVFLQLLPEVAEQTIKAANHLREHLADLKYQQYEDNDDSALAKEIAALSEDEKRDRYIQKQRQAVAMEIRLRLKAEEDNKMVAETIARHSVRKGAPKQPMPDFSRTAGRDEDADAWNFKDLAEPVVTEGKGQRASGWGRAVRRRSEVKAVQGSDWADAAPAIPIRKQLSKKDASSNRTALESEARAKLEDAGGARAEMSERAAEDEQAEESVSVPTQESASDVQLVDDEVKDSYVPFQESENEHR